MSQSHTQSSNVESMNGDRGRRRRHQAARVKMEVASVFVPRPRAVVFIPRRAHLNFSSLRSQLGDLAEVLASHTIDELELVQLVSTSARLHLYSISWLLEVNSASTAPSSTLDQ